MPQVRLYEGGNVQATGLTSARLQPVQGAPSILQMGLEAGGQATEKVADIQQAINETVDEASAKHLYNQYVEHSDRVLHSGDNPFYALSGKAALDARPIVEQSLHQRQSDLIAAATSPYQRKLLTDALGPRVEEDLKGVGSHAITQGIQYNVDESSSRVSVLSADAARNYLDPKIVEGSIAAIRGEVANLGLLNHWGPDQISAHTLKSVSAAQHDIAIRYAGEGAQGPDIARRYVQAHDADFTPDDRQSVLDHADAEQRTREAEQRRIEAEQRRQEAERRREAGQQADDTLRLVDQHVPLPPAQQAQAIANARASGRPGLEESLKVGFFKNNLTVQYQDHTPVEIQGRLNVLGPKIKAAGDHPDAKDVIEFEHLSALRDKSAGDLRSDPISWGAAHLGLRVAPLNPADPASLAARAQRAIEVSRRTGAPIRPLTQPEAAGMAATVATGSVDARRGLIGQLAAFGAAASGAAEQVAPNDNVFQGLVGLATSSNPVARNYVGLALSGVEVRKRNPAVVDQNQARARFNNYAGGAFRLLPTVADGVFNNAQNIVAAWADQHGHTDWKHDTAIGDEFEGSVDAALGSYHQGGVKYGGLGMWKGERIVLPDGMSQQQLERRFTGANQSALMRGSNGVPVWSDGHPLKVGEVKNMHLVAVGDGVYRLTDGHSYVATKGGGFYELNIKAVR